MGFPEGNHTFELFHDGVLLDTQIIPVVPHEIIEHNISFGINGDINGDGALKILDVVIIVNQILSNEYQESSDLNDDGSLNILDIIQMINLILER